MVSGGINFKASPIILCPVHVCLCVIDHNVITATAQRTIILLGSKGRHRETRAESEVKNDNSQPGADVSSDCQRQNSLKETGLLLENTPKQRESVSLAVSVHSHHPHQQSQQRKGPESQGSRVMLRPLPPPPPFCWQSEKAGKIPTIKFNRI